MLKKVVTYVIAIVGVLSLIPSIIIISNSAIKKTETIEFTVNTTDMAITQGSYEKFFNLLETHGKTDVYGIRIDNNIEIYINNNIIDSNDKEIFYDNSTNTIIISEYIIIDAGLIEIIENDEYQEMDYSFNNNDTIKITYDIYQDNVFSTLLSLVPLILIGGLLGYLLLFNNKENE